MSALACLKVFVGEDLRFADAEAMSTPDDQSRFMLACEGLSPEPGGRGKRGVTRVRLAALDQTGLAPVLKAAWVQAGGPSADYV